jgi:hypothetical protein
MTTLRFLAATAALACAASFTGCASTPSGAAAPQHVDGGVRLPVTGVDGWQFNRVLRFGDYATSAVGPSKGTISADSCLPDCANQTSFGSPGHLPIYRKQFDDAYRSATAKVAFDQHGPDAQTARVRADYDARRFSDLQMTEWMGFVTSVKGNAQFVTSFTGLIEPAAPGQAAWHFAMTSDDAIDTPATPAGWIVDDNGRRLTILKAPFPAGTPAFVVQMAHNASPGYRFELDGQVVASVGLFPEKAVWMRDDLAPDVRLALAALSSALLLRPH